MARNLVAGEGIGEDGLIRLSAELPHTGDCEIPEQDLLPTSARLVYWEPSGFDDSIPRPAVEHVEPQGKLLEFEEPKLYGLWNGQRWFGSGAGEIFHTPYLRIALITHKMAAIPEEWPIVEIGPDGEPVECP